jgi:hypothetical protein
MRGTWGGKREGMETAGGAVQWRSGTLPSPPAAPPVREVRAPPPCSRHAEPAAASWSRCPCGAELHATRRLFFMCFLPRCMFCTRSSTRPRLGFSPVSSSVQSPGVGRSAPTLCVGSFRNCFLFSLVGRPRPLNPYMHSSARFLFASCSIPAQAFDLGLATLALHRVDAFGVVYSLPTHSCLIDT